MPEHLFFSEVLSGLTDLKATATIVGYDVLKFIGAKALERLRDPSIKRRILKNAEQRLIRDGMSQAQARHLMTYVRDADFLGQGIRDDVTQLEARVIASIDFVGEFGTCRSSGWIIATRHREMLSPGTIT